MRLHGRVLKHPWMLALAAVVLIAGHGLLYGVLSKMPLPVATVSGVILLIVIKLGLLYSRFRRRSRP